MRYTKYLDPADRPLICVVFIDINWILLIPNKKHLVQSVLTFKKI